MSGWKWKKELTFVEYLGLCRALCAFIRTVHKHAIFSHREYLYSYFTGQLLPHFLVPLCNRTPGRSGLWFLTFHSLPSSLVKVPPRCCWTQGLVLILVSLSVALDMLNTPPSVKVFLHLASRTLRCAFGFPPSYWIFLPHRTDRSGFKHSTNPKPTHSSSAQIRTFPFPFSLFPFLYSMSKLATQKLTTRTPFPTSGFPPGSQITGFPLRILSPLLKSHQVFGASLKHFPWPS